MKKIVFLFLSCVLVSCGTISPSSGVESTPSVDSSLIPSIPKDSELPEESPSKDNGKEDETSGFGEFLD